MKQTSVLIHYTHKQTLGHSTRVLSIAQALINHYGKRIKLTILQGGVPQPFLKFPENARLIHIPAPFDTRASFKGISQKKLTEARAHFVLEAARRINPDVFITEFFPFGRIEYLDELLPALRHLQQNGTRIYSSIGYPHLANIMLKGENHSLDLILKIINMYEKILIHTPQEMENPYFLKTFRSDELKKQFVSFFREIAHKIVYTGYVLPQQPKIIKKHAHLLNKDPGQFLVVVSRGGGAVYPKIISHAIRAQAILGDKYRFVIASGPATSQAEKEFFNLIQKKHPQHNAVLTDYLPNLSCFLGHCDASISMCGYNTSVQLLSFGTPSVIIPYVNEHSQISSNEQLARSLLLQDHIQSTSLSYETMTAETMAKAVEQQCTKTSKHPAPSHWFNGNATTAQIIVERKNEPTTSNLRKQCLDKNQIGTKRNKAEELLLS